jgi:hypothetical protein
MTAAGERKENPAFVFTESLLSCREDRKSLFLSDKLGYLNAGLVMAEGALPASPPLHTHTLC